MQVLASKQVSCEPWVQICPNVVYKDRGSERNRQVEMMLSQ